MFTTPSHKEKIMQDAKILAADVQSYFGDMSEEKKQDARETAEAFREQWEKTREHARKMGGQVNRKAQENVWATAGIAALVGVVVGLLASGASRRRW